MEDAIVISVCSLQHRSHERVTRQRLIECSLSNGIVSKRERGPRDAVNASQVPDSCSKEMEELRSVQARNVGRGRMFIVFKTCVQLCTKVVVTAAGSADESTGESTKVFPPNSA